MLLLDAAYALGTLWGTFFSPPVCPSNSSIMLPFQPVRPVASGVAAATAFVDVSVVPMDTERVLRNQTVLVEGGRITALGPVATVPVPTGATRIDGRGKYLLPGFANMHVHTPDIFETADYSFAGLAEGITFLRVTGNGLAATSNIEALWQQRDEAPVPRFHLSKLPFGSHSHTSSFENMLKLGRNGGSIEHLYSFLHFLAKERNSTEPSQNSQWMNLQESDAPLAKIQELAAATKRAGVWITPTADCLDAFGNRAPVLVTIHRRIIKALQEAGVGLLMGNDGAGMDELQALVLAGLTPYQALATGTRNIAQYLGILDSAGTVAVGKRADLVLFAANPLADIGHARQVAGVMIDGRWLGRAELDRRLFASPKNWPRVVTRISPNRVLEEAPRKQLYMTYDPLKALADSLEAVKSSDKISFERLLRRMAAMFGTVRAALPPEQQKELDLNAQPWLRELARQGHRVMIPGVRPIP